LRKLTLIPRASSNAPMEALARPFPRDERTPPVIKMYFIASTSSKISWKRIFMKYSAD
jgi:hypothetical protein